MAALFLFVKDLSNEEMCEYCKYRDECPGDATNANGKIIYPPCSEKTRVEIADEQKIKHHFHYEVVDTKGVKIIKQILEDINGLEQHGNALETVNFYYDYYRKHYKGD